MPGRDEGQGVVNNNNTPYRAFRLESTCRESVALCTLLFEASLPGAQPGQFVMVWLPGIGEKPLCVAGADPLMVMVAEVGAFSRALGRLKPGERAWVRGPYGNGFAPDGERHLLIGGGYGAAPLLFLARQAVPLGHEMLVCLGARSSQDLILADDFRQLGCEVRVATEDGTLGTHGLVTQTAAEGLAHFHADGVYACGPVAMLGAVAGLCQERGLPAQLSYEALMRCGIGLCGSCELDEDTRKAAGIPAGWLTCKDGPVFHLRS